MLNIFHDDGGSGGLPVVFVHSLAGNTQQWAAQLDHVRETRRGVALDLRGHGRSSSPSNDDYAIDSLAQDVHTVVEQLDLKSFVLVGHSLGGSVAAAYAGTYPDHVAGLLLVDPTGDSTQIPVEQVQSFIGALESEAYAQTIEGYWQRILTGSTAATEASVMETLRQTPKAAVVGALKAPYSYNPIPALERYHGPKLSVITPLNETPFSLHNLVPNLPHVLITGTGHWLHMDKPDQFNRILDDFLVRLNDKENVR